jgi:IMP dehydrogenase
MKETLESITPSFDVPKGDMDDLFKVWSASKIHGGYRDIDMLTENVNSINYDEVDFSGYATRDIKIPSGIVGAAMNTMSSEKTATAAGGVGSGMILHHANTIEEQYKMVRATKLNRNGRIENPTAAKIYDNAGDVLRNLKEKNRDYRTLTIVDDDDKFLGIVSGTHFDLFKEDLNKMTMNEIMTPADEVTTMQYGDESEPDDAKHKKAWNLMRDKKIKMLPVLNDDRTVNSLYLSEDLARIIHGNPDGYFIGEDGRYITFASVSADPQSACERTDRMKDVVDIVVINTSHGENIRTFNTLDALKKLIKTIKHDHGDSISVWAGNISTWQTAQELAKAGPEGVIIGQGPGSACESHNRLGYGTAQATAVYECAPAIKAVNKNIMAIADGAIREPADYVKARALGADCVVAGSLFAATDEAPMPEVKMPNGNLGKEYYGMGSEKAQREFRAARERYGHFDGTYDGVIFSEGKEMVLPLKGSIAKVLEEFYLGIRISMGGMGFRNVDNLRHGLSLRQAP